MLYNVTTFLKHFWLWEHQVMKSFRNYLVPFFLEICRCATAQYCPNPIIHLKLTCTSSFGDRTGLHAGQFSMLSSSTPQPYLCKLCRRWFCIIYLKNGWTAEDIDPTSRQGSQKPSNISQSNTLRMWSYWQMGVLDAVAIWGFRDDCLSSLDVHPWPLYSEIYPDSVNGLCTVEKEIHKSFYEEHCFWTLQWFCWQCSASHRLGLRWILLLYQSIIEITSLE